MVNTSSGWRQQRLGMAVQAQAQRPQSSAGVQDATTRTMACAVCKAVYTPAPTHQQLVMAPHIVLESAFMSMCHFCFRCRRTACPDCWDAVHGVCGACVKEAHLPFRTQVKPLSNIMPSLPQQPQAVAVEATHTASVLICIQHGRFHADSPQIPSPTPPSHPVPPVQMRRPVRVASPESGQRRTQQHTTMTRVAPEYPTHTAHKTHTALTEHRERLTLREEDETKNEREQQRQPEQLEQAEKLEQPVSRILGVTEQWLTGILLSLLLTIVTLMVIAEASPSANAQIMHLFNIDIRSEIAYLVHLMGQLQL
jgi:hypothetical protein